MRHVLPFWKDIIPGNIYLYIELKYNTVLQVALWHVLVIWYNCAFATLLINQHHILSPVQSDKATC